MDGNINVQTMRIPPYGELAISGHETIAFVNGNVPYVYLRIGSDNFRLQCYNCVPISSNFVRIVNPFPRQAEIVIGRGLPVSLFSESSVFPLHQQLNTQSSFFAYVPATAGYKYAVGVMLKRGTAIVEVTDTVNDAFSFMMLFPHAREDFLSFKPVGAMADATVFRYADGQPDTAAVAVSGLYTDADVTAWVAAAGYSGQIITRSGALTNTAWRYEAADDCAVFFVRDVNKAAQAIMRLTHRGARQEDYE